MRDLDKLKMEIGSIAQKHPRDLVAFGNALAPVFRERDEALARVQKVEHDLGLELQRQWAKADAQVRRLKARVEELEAAWR